jgi:hypothetical protein
MPDRAVELGFALQRIELAAFAHRAQEALHYQTRGGLRAKLGPREKHLRATSNGDPTLEHEGPEWLRRFGLALLRHGTLIMQAKTRRRRGEMQQLQ